MVDLEKQILTTINEQGLFHGKTTVIVGVSGGPDSLALLSILKKLESLLALRIIAVYIDHKLRPGESLREAELVEKISRHFEVEYYKLTVDVPELVQRHKQSIEQAARELRYKGFRNLAKKYEESVIAVAHTADDQAEEILIRLIRGSGRKGLSGMLYKNQDIVRPLLDIPKERLIRYLNENNIEYCIDSSNKDEKYLRNRVRYELIPFLEKRFDQGIRKALLKSASNLADDEELLQDMTNLTYHEVVNIVENNSSLSANLDRIRFASKPKALQRRFIEKLLWDIGSSASYKHIFQIIHAAIYGRTGSELHLKMGLRVGIKSEILEFSYPKGKAPWRGSLYNHNNIKVQ